MQYKRTRKPLAEIGRKLNVDAVVEGTVVRSGNNVRITAQLVRTASDQHLWAEEFEGELRDMLTLQSEVARAIATQIRVKLTQQQMQVIAARTINPEAYEYYLKGRYAFSERSSKEGDDNAIRYFEMAIENAPNYAPPYAGLAHCYALGSFQGMELSPREAWSKGAAAAKKALELDDQLAEAHIAMANVRFRFDWNWPEAEREFHRGLELSPNDALGHASYSTFLGVMGRFDEAMAETRRARELDPLSPSISMGMSWIYSWSRRQDVAITELRRTLELDPNFSAAHSALVWSYEEKGMYAEAVSEELKVEALTGHSPEQIESLRNAFAASGIRGFWEKRLQWEKRQLNHPRYFIIARLCVRLGRTDEAFDWLEKAYSARYPNMPNIKVAALWLDPVRSDQRYVDLLRRVGLPP
jgi:tetratricopeptide (TPR) repeat protein